MDFFDGFNIICVLMQAKDNHFFCTRKRTFLAHSCASYHQHASFFSNFGIFSYIIPYNGYHLIGIQYIKYVKLGFDVHN